MSDLRVPVAFDPEGRQVVPEDAVKSTNYRCSSKACKQVVRLRRAYDRSDGVSVTAHFFHLGESPECLWKTRESLEHFFAIDYLRRLGILKVERTRTCGHTYRVDLPGKVATAKPEDLLTVNGRNYRPDVTYFDDAGNIILAIEVLHTHAVDEKKAKDLSCAVDWIEVSALDVLRKGLVVVTQERPLTDPNCAECAEIRRKREEEQKREKERRELEARKQLERERILAAKKAKADKITPKLLALRAKWDEQERQRPKDWREQNIRVLYALLVKTKNEGYWLSYRQYLLKNGYVTPRQFALIVRVAHKHDISIEPSVWRVWGPISDIIDVHKSNPRTFEILFESLDPCTRMHVLVYLMQIRDPDLDVLASHPPKGLFTSSGVPGNIDDLIDDLIDRSVG